MFDGADRDDIEGSLDRIKEAEDLDSARDALIQVIDDYEAFPGYPGGFSQFCIDYEEHLRNLRERIRDEDLSVKDYIIEGYPNTFLANHGVDNIVELRESYGRYASEKLSGPDREYLQTVEDLLEDKGKEAGLSPNRARDVAAEVSETLSEWLVTRTFLNQNIVGYLPETSRSIFEE